MRVKGRQTFAEEVGQCQERKERAEGEGEGEGALSPLSSRAGQEIKSEISARPSSPRRRFDTPSTFQPFSHSRLLVSPPAHIWPPPPSLFPR